MGIHFVAEPCIAIQFAGQSADRSNRGDSHDRQRLDVFVIFTNPPGTLAALEMANRLTGKLDTRVRLIMPYEVHHSLPLNQPPVQVEFLERQLGAVATQAVMEIAGQVLLCRDKQRALEALLGPNSLVIVGGRRRWWPTPEQQLAQALTQGGHQVIFAELR
jgi:predicted nucleotidyltransferase